MPTSSITIQFDIIPEKEGFGPPRSVTVTVSGVLRGFAAPSRQVVASGYSVVRDSTAIDGDYPIYVLDSADITPRSYGWLRSTEGAEEVSVTAGGLVQLSARGSIDLADQGALSIGSPEGWVPAGHFGLTIGSAPFHTDPMSLWFRGAGLALTTMVMEFEDAPEVSWEVNG